MNSLLRFLVNRLLDFPISQRPSAAYRNQISTNWSDSPNFQSHASFLCEHGYLSLQQYIPNKLLSQIRAEFEEVAGTKSYNSASQLEFIRDDLEWMPALYEFSLDPYLTSLVRFYFGKPVFLAEASGKRSNRALMPELGNNQWHHDAKGKQIKIFLLLSDVGEYDSQATSLLAGTHKLKHKYSTYQDTRYSQEDVDMLFYMHEIVRLYGPAGTVFLFDTNGIHRANRNGKRRDVFVFNYTTGRGLFPFPQVAPVMASKLSPEQKEVLRLD